MDEEPNFFIRKQENEWERVIIMIDYNSIF